MDGILPVAAKELLAQGALGIIIFFLIWYIGRLEVRHAASIAEKNAEIQKLHDKIAAKDARIEQLHADQLTDAKQFVEIAQGLRTQGQAFLAAIERKT